MWVFGHGRVEEREREREREGALKGGGLELKRKEGCGILAI